MKKIIVFLLLTCSAFADDSIPFKTSTGKAKISTSGIGTVAKPYDFQDVNVINIGAGGGGAPGGLDKQVQYKNVTTFGGIPNLTYDGGAVVLTLAAGTKFNMVDSVDLTKKLRFTLSGITTASTRTFTIPNADFTGVIPTTATTNQFVTAINSTGTQLKAQPTEANLLLSDITTNNVSALRHGLVPKIPNDATKYLDGTGAFTVPAGGGGAPGGSTTQLQRNNAGAFGGVSTLTSDGTIVTQKAGTNYLLVDPTDATKKAQYTLSNITTATTRTVTVPNANSNFVVPDTGAANNFLTAISALGVISKAQPTFANIAGVLTPAQNNIPIGKTLYVDAVNGNNITAVTNRLDKPYLTLNGASGAIADAAAGDQIIIGPGTFNETGAVVIPQNVAFTGSGAGITTIVTTGGIKPGTGDKLADFTIDARTGSNASFTFGIGADTGDTAFTDVTISGVEIKGNTDGFYFNKVGIDRVSIYDCLVTTTFDTVFMGNLTGAVTITNTDMFADGSIGGASIMSGVNATKGILNLYGGSITLSNGVLDARGIRAQNSGTIVNVHGTTFSETATTNFDFHQSSSAVIANDQAIRSDRAALVSSGTITPYVNTYEGNFGLSDVVTGNVNALRHGLAPKSPGNAALYLDGTGAYSAPSGAGVTAGSGIDITSNVISVNSTVISDQVYDATPTMDDQILTYDPVLDDLRTTTLNDVADNLTIIGVIDPTSGFRESLDTSNLTANRLMVFPDATSTAVVPSLGSSAPGKANRGVNTDGTINWGNRDKFTVPQFTADQNDWTPSTSAHFLEVSSDGTRTITGMQDSQLAGSDHVIYCSTNSVVLANQNAGSVTPQNRFITSTGSDITLTAGQMAYLVYNTTSNRWLVGSIGSSSSTGTVTNIATTSPITGGPITTTGTLELNVGTNFAFTSPQSITLTDAGTTTTPTLLSYAHMTSGTAAAGFGLTSAMSAETDNGTARSIGQNIWSWTNATDATRTSKLTLGLTNSGSNATVMHLYGSGGWSMDSTDPGSNSLRIGTMELGLGTDTTVARASAGHISVEGAGVALDSNNLGFFSATTSSQFKVVISDENAPDGASSKVIMALGSLSIASGKTLTASNTLTLAGTDSTTMTFPATSASIARTDAAQSFTGVQTFVAPVLGTPTSATLTNATGLPPTTGIVGWPANASGALTNNGSGTLSWAASGAGTVTHTGGALTSNAVVLGAGTDDTKVVTSIVTDGGGILTLGPAVTGGAVKMFGSTSGDATIQPPANAGTATVVTLPSASSTLPIMPQQLTYTGPTAARTITFPDASFTAARTDAAQTFTGVQTFTAPILGTPTSETLTNATGLPVAGITASTTTALGVGSLELGHATDTTLSRNAAGVLQVEGVVVPTVSSTNTLTNKTLTSPTLTTPVLGTPTSGTLTNCTGGGGYTMEGAMPVTFSPADATTYYIGYGEGVSTALHTAIANAQMTVPKTGTITRVHFVINNGATNGTNESVSHYLRVNNTTDTTLSTSETYDQGTTTAKSFIYSGQSIAVSAGDTIAFKIVTPTWATNPAITSSHLLVWIE